MLPEFYISKRRHLYQHFHTTLQLRYPQLNERKQLHMNDLDIEMLSTLSKERFTSEYPRSLIEEVLDDFQLEYCEASSQWLEVHDDFIDFLIQQRPLPTTADDGQNARLAPSKLAQPHKTNSIQSWCSESSVPVTETSTKDSSQWDSSEYSIIQTDDGNFPQDGYSPAVGLPPLPPIKGNYNQVMDAVNSDTEIWMPSD
ncbi:hypothetical protein K493DRAFT_297774 [Basidiobolus meristosporus CBS 931.73]|uniref:Uncharacterized protein n=1 Tax=Basidiobolus meristosporus CBS 931.73 TaxID=1314790 RepID=A0A1Y1YXP2_9FUNG|nr:hypothetical protein K493DRAFT_297774 [Basidiobolus meristosporus CBS 931.73]|eukprot:ORY02706.1 hypothetical protein K493DRAFT_297774 [Basidiobolus meristosporus CBS 931.73]